MNFIKLISILFLMLSLSPALLGDDKSPFFYDLAKLNEQYRLGEGTLPQPNGETLELKLGKIIRYKDSRNADQKETTKEYTFNRKINLIRSYKDRKGIVEIVAATENGVETRAQKANGSDEWSAWTSIYSTKKPITQIEMLVDEKDRLSSVIFLSENTLYVAREPFGVRGVKKLTSDKLKMFVLRRQRIFTLSTDGEVKVAALKELYGNSKAWTDLEGKDFTSIRVGVNPDRRLELFALKDGKVFHRYELTPDSQQFYKWRRFGKFEKVTDLYIEAVLRQEGIYFIVGNSSENHFVSQTLNEKGQAVSWLYREKRLASPEPRIRIPINQTITDFEEP